MKVWSNIITEQDVRAAFRSAHNDHGQDIWLDDGVRTFKPRREAYGFEFFAVSLNGNRATGHRAIGSYPLTEEYGVQRAASWSAYGYVIAYLFNIDPHARVSYYDNAADFVAKVRQQAAFARQGESLDFLDTLTDIGEYA